MRPEERAQQTTNTYCYDEVEGTCVEWRQSYGTRYQVERANCHVKRTVVKSWRRCAFIARILTNMHYKNYWIESKLPQKHHLTVIVSQEISKNNCCFMPNFTTQQTMPVFTHNAAGMMVDDRMLTGRTKEFELFVCTDCIGFILDFIGILPSVFHTR